MDPVTLITTALVLGITAGLKPTVEQAIKDSYAGLKALIVNRYKVSLTGLENKPDSDVQLAAVAEQLKDGKAAEDSDVIKAAEALIQHAEKNEETRKHLEHIQVNLTRNKQFAFSVSGSATYNEK